MAHHHGGRSVAGRGGARGGRVPEYRARTARHAFDQERRLMALVVDTDIASFLFKKDTRAALYAPHLAGHMLTISFQTLAELELWALSAGWGVRRKQQLEHHLRRYIVQDSSPALR